MPRNHRPVAAHRKEILLSQDRSCADCGAPITATAAPEWVRAGEHWRAVCARCAVGKLRVRPVPVTVLVEVEDLTRLHTAADAAGLPLGGYLRTLITASLQQTADAQ